MTPVEQPSEPNEHRQVMDRFLQITSTERLERSGPRLDFGPGYGLCIYYYFALMADERSDTTPTNNKLLDRIEERLGMPRDCVVPVMKGDRYPKILTSILRN